MAASSAGSSTVFALGLLAIAFLVLLLLRHYLPLRSTPAYLLLPVFLAIALPASIILLVPVDLASNAVEDDGTARGIWLPERAISVLWRISYWLTFVLTWLILPLLGEYVDAGHREPREKMMYSLRSNAKFQLIVLVFSVVGLVYFIYQSQGFSAASLKALVISLAYAWGLILAIYLMGHGLVAVPRKLFRNASTSARLRNLEAQASKIHDRLTEALEDLDGLEGQVVKLRQRKTGSARDFQDWIEELIDTSDLPEARIATGRADRATEAHVPAVITERYLADLTRKLKRARHKRIRFIDEWDRLAREAKSCQDILDAAGSRRLEFTYKPSSGSLFNKITPMTPTTRYYIYAKILPVCRLALSFLLALASVSIIWSEVLKSQPKLSIIGLSIVHHPNSTSKGKIGFGGQVMAACWLLYMCAAALYSVTEVKVWGNRALVTRHTYAESACWYAALVARLTIPLSYNFITFVPTNIFDKTQFYVLLGRSITFTPLGSGFSKFFPIFILLPVIATAFNLYSRVRSIAGFGAFEDESDESNPNGFGTGGWREGRALLEREWNGTAANINALGLSSPRSRSPLSSADRYTDGISSQNNLNVVTDGGLAPATGPDRQRYLSPTAAQPRAEAQTQPRAARRYQDEPEAGEGNFFEDFAHRVRNTFETAEPPEWIARIPKPKWMNGDGGSNASSGSNSGGRGEGSALGRFFSEGGLRLG